MISEEVKCSGLFIFTRAVNAEKKDGGESMLGMSDQHMKNSYIRWIYEPQVQQFVHIVQLHPTSVLAYLTSSVHLSENVPGAFYLTFATISAQIQGTGHMCWDAFYVSHKRCGIRYVL